MIVRERPVRTSYQTARRSRKKQTGSSTGRTCSACGRKMTVRNGRHGRFLGCSGYPRCRNTRSLR
jgi:ssDNA-binding Zn-finger/Zn-ribbon topoisomerase 1